MICKFKPLNSLKIIQKQLFKNYIEGANCSELKNKPDKEKLQNSLLLKQKQQNQSEKQQRKNIIKQEQEQQKNYQFKFNYKFSYSLWKSKNQVNLNQSHYRKSVKNYEMFMLESQFHQKGNLIIKGKSIQQKFLKNIQIRHIFQPLCKVLQQIVKVRNKIDPKLILRQKSVQNQNKQYFQLYKNLNHEIQSLLKSIDLLETKKVEVKQIRIDLMSLVGYFKCVQFNEYYLLKLLKQSKNFQQTISNIDLLNKLKNQNFNISTSFHIQKHINNFYKSILCIFMNNYLLKEKETKQMHKLNIFEAFQILYKIDKVLNQTNVYEKQKFVYNFMQNHLQQVIKQIQNKIHNHKYKYKQTLNSLIQIFKYYVSSVNYDDQTIKKFQNILIQNSQHFKNDINQEASKNLLKIYQNVSISQPKIYTIYIKPYLYHNLQNIENIAQALSFYTNSQCKDKVLLSNCLSYLEYFYKQKNKFQTTPKKISKMHVSLHYLKIKKQIKYIRYQFEKQLTNLCQKSNHIRNCLFMREIIKKMGETKIINECVSMIKENNSYNTGFQQHKNTYFQEKARKIIEQFVQAYNMKYKGVSQLRYIQNYKFCIYQLDFAIFQIGSNKQLLSFVNLQMTSLQYFSPHVKQQTILSSLENGQIIPQKNGKLKRSKIIRQQILQHYGWQVIYLSNFIFKEKDQYISANKELSIQQKEQLNVKEAAQKNFVFEILSKTFKTIVNVN